MYHDIDFVSNLFSQMVMQKLGVINDYAFELDYFNKVSKNGEHQIVFNYSGLSTLKEYLLFF